MSFDFHDFEVSPDGVKICGQLVVRPAYVPRGEWLAFFVGLKDYDPYAVEDEQDERDEEITELQEEIDELKAKIATMEQAAAGAIITQKPKGALIYP